MSEIIADLIRRFELAPHPEGGFYREIHRSERSVGVPPGYPGDRVALTGIYFLLGRNDFSAFHRVRSEEVWVHLAGAPLELVVLDRRPLFCRLSAVEDGGQPLAVVPADALQAARTTGEWSFLTCLVAPGFEFDDFEIPDRDQLVRRFPAHPELIRRFTR